MGKPGIYFRRVLYRSLSFERYLLVLSKVYFALFWLGLLKNEPNYAYPYFMRRILRKGDIVIDMGANLGYLTRLFAKLTGRDGKVYAVEPIEPIIKVLRNNTRRLGNVEILPYALGRENKPILLGNDTRKHKGFVASGSNFVLDPEATDRTEAEVQFKAEMRRGSELFKDLDRIDLIKVDVEGYETVIIPEMEQVLLKHMPMLLMETKREKRKYMRDFLEQRGYRAYVLHNGQLHPPCGKGPEDILFVPDVRMDRISGYIWNEAEKADR